MNNSTNPYPASIAASASENPITQPDSNSALAPHPEKQGGGKKALKIFAVFVVVCLGLFAASLAVVFPKRNQIILELGEGLPMQPGDYLYGYSFIIDKAEMDISDVDYYSIGDYPIRPVRPWPEQNGPHHP